ncbi:hypothetical protein GN958_ATG01654 [Phytophthora infestans]|uniref:Uncharacterized protein n=1 Tax=Phytophthora infestans TaxID=4787 RepID=A0A8S9V946_PHYIN|nr:hypothetical protein GN958_ATG01654 [Phytophthora infestans]
MKLDYLDKITQVALPIAPVDAPISPRDIETIVGNGPSVRETLSKYGVDLIARLEKALDLYNRGEISLLRSDDKHVWDTAVRSWEMYAKAKN